MKRLALNQIAAEPDDDTARNEPLQEIVYLLPSEIPTDERYNVRRYSPGDDADQEAIDFLAESMEQVGQIDDLVLSQGQDGTQALTSGHRRMRAMALINSRRVANHQNPLKLRCRVDRQPGDLLRKALTANIQRQNLSPMEMAENIRRIRAENHWPGAGNTQKVAHYLGVSKTTITQHEKFLSKECDEETRQRLHRKEISAQSALDMIQRVPVIEQRPGVYGRAVDIQKAKNIDTAIKDVKTRRRGRKKIVEDLHSKKQIRHAAIEEAIRETPGVHPVPMRRKDIMGLFRHLASRAVNDAEKEFIAAFVELVSGRAGPDGVRTLTAKFHALSRHIEEMKANGLGDESHA